MTTCDPSRRPDQATQRMALDVVRRFVTIGSFGAADAVHDLAADAGCPACVITSVTQLMLAVAAATRIGSPAEPAWRDGLSVPAVRAYAKVALAQLSGVDLDGDSLGGLPAELDMTPDDLAWIATDLLALAVDEEFPDPDDLEVSFREAVPAGREQMFFEGIARGTHPDTVLVLTYLGEYHPDREIAKAARTAAHRAASRP